MLRYFDLVIKHAQNDVISGSMPRWLLDTSEMFPLPSRPRLMFIGTLASSVAFELTLL